MQTGAPSSDFEVLLAPGSARFDVPRVVPLANADIADSLRRAVQHLESLQETDGSWEAEMVWNTMLLSQYVIVRRITGRFPLPARERRQIIKHYAVRQRSDGSWPMHIESEGFMFFTSIAYVSLRMLGVDKDDPMLVRARAWLQARDVRTFPPGASFGCRCSVSPSTKA
jgi:hypothetical protein